MADSPGTPRRFAPIPIETTYQSIRKTPKLGEPSRIGPNPELTPEPSPKELWTSLPSRPKPSPPRRRFAPQLIETSRRTFRLGDPGPATRPTDKTDITPYTNHIYTFKAKHHRRRDDEAIEDGDDEEERHLPPTRRETEDEGVKEYLLELAAKEADRQMQEDALAAFPNSRAREGGVDHFYFREGSSSEDSGQVSPAAETEVRPRARRKSSNLGLTWWHKHMQDHAEKLAAQDEQDKVTEAPSEESEEEERGRARRRETSQSLIRSDSDLDRMELPGPPDPLWTTNTPMRHDSSSAEEAEALALSARLARDGVQDIFSGVAPPSSLSGIGSAQHLQPPPSSSHLQQPSSQQANLKKHNNEQQGGAQQPAGRSPFAALGLRPDAAQLERLRKFKSPPMLGQELHFRKCPSPKQTKLETDHPFNKKRHEDGCANSGQDEKNRDMSGKGGLWRGYCCRSESSGGDGGVVQYLVPAELKPTGLLATPFPPGTPSPLDYAISDEPEPVPLLSPSASTDSFTSSSGVGGLAGAAARGASAANGAKTNSGGATLAPPPQAAGGGLHMLHGLGERLAQEKARAERDEKIAAEFDDAFVTQVFNYLSLGYPSMARGFDEELAKISRVPVDELTSCDAAAAGVKGYLLEASADETIPDEDRCPRWRALKTYIYEWARQHPDLDSFDPLAWGVRERRGSWAI